MQPSVQRLPPDLSARGIKNQCKVKPKMETSPQEKDTEKEVVFFFLSLLLSRSLILSPLSRASTHVRSSSRRRARAQPADQPDGGLAAAADGRREHSAWTRGKNVQVKKKRKRKIVRATFFFPLSSSSLSQKTSRERTKKRKGASRERERKTLFLSALCSLPLACSLTPQITGIVF